MEQDTHKTKVVFRKFPDGEVIALFYEEEFSHPGNFTSYMHVGQHGQLEEYSILVAMCNHATDDKLQYAVKQFVLWYVLPRVNKLYEQYNYPDTYEQWMERQYK